MKRDKYPQIGFTLIEILVSSFILLLVGAGIIAIYLLYSTAWEEGSVQTTLQRKASTAMEKMVRGIGGSDGIREATKSSITINSAKTQIQYESGGTTRKFYLDAENGILYYVPNISAPNNKVAIAHDVRTSTTTNPPGFRIQESDDQIGDGIIEVVAINMGLGKVVRNRKINVDLCTQVKIRN